MRSRLFWSALVFVCLSSSAHAGFLEICKDSFPAGALTGLFSFTIAGQSGTFETPIGACTPAIQLPDGLANIIEVPRPDAMFLSVFTFPLNRLVSFDPILGSAIVQIVTGDISTETVVTFTNTPDVATVPEPGSITLLSMGLLSLILRGRRSRKQAA